MDWLTAPGKMKWPGSDLLCEPRIRVGWVRLDFDPLSLWLERAGQGLVDSSSGDTRSPCSGTSVRPGRPTGAAASTWGDHHRHVPAAPSTLVRTLQTIPAQSKVRALCTKLRNRESADLCER